MTTFSLATPQVYTDTLPRAVDVVVIGGGIIGVCTAYYLARSGVSVLLCEKGRIAGEQSSRNWGWVRQHNRDPAELPIMMESNRIWNSLSAEIGEDVGYRQHGVIYLASTGKKLARRESWLEYAREHQLDTRMITAAEVEKMIDCKAGQWVGASYTPSDGRAEPWIAVPAIARAAHRRGVLIRENCAVRSIEKTDGEVSAVVTEDGVVICSRVVLAAGAWSSLFARNLAIRLPQLTVRSTVVSTTQAPDVYSGNAADEKVAFRRRQDGGYSMALCDLTEHFIGPDSIKNVGKFIPAMLTEWDTYRLAPSAPAGFPDAWRTPRSWADDEISPFERNRVLNPSPNQRAVDKIMQRAKARLPALADAQVSHSWAGMIDTMPDVVPVIDQLDNPKGLIIATGFSGHGFGIGPAAGKIVAELVQNKPASHDLTRFRLNRFSDGSKIELGPAL